MRGFVGAATRSDAARDARWLSLVAIGTRGDTHHLDRTLDRLTTQATEEDPHRAHRRSHR